MTDTKKELKSVLTRVVDSADGYESAAKDADQGRFAVMFREKAQERRGFATEIRNHLSGLGEQVDEDGSLLAAGHRAFKGLRDAVTGSDDTAVLKEVDRGESTLLKEYDDALKDVPAGDQAHALLERQRASVSQTLTQIKGFENQS